jgi:transcription-repair coupling factor (superfamily II helicase)
VLQRAEVLTRINKSDNLIVVSYPEAIQEKVITKKSLERNTLEIKLNERLSTDFIQEFLIENKFERTDFVYEPGQFAIRGGIVDIYSFAHELPYRIEFYNDKIESIRCFDPSTQLSEKNIGFVTIIPNIQTGIVKEEQETFFKFIAKNTLFFIKDLEYVYQCIQASQEVTEQNYGSNIFYEEEQVERNIDDIFDSIEIFKENLEARTIIEFGSKPYNNNVPVIEFKTKPQPHFNKNFNLLLEDLYKSQKKGYTNLLFSDQAKQAERIHSIFEDIPRPD